MPTFVALLRGVNVGGAKRVPMADLRALLCELGYTNVSTVLNSGNAVFTAAGGTTKSHASAIARGIADRLNLEVPVLVKSARELFAIVAENTLCGETADPSRLLVAYAPDRESLAALAPIAALAKPPDRFHLGAHAAYLHCPAGSLQSPAGAALLGKQGGSITTRNWATTLKLHALATQGAA
jgi:uncharacterized protein (DUF1697 family)